MQSLSTRVPKILAKQNQGVRAKQVQELRPTRSLHCCYKYSSKTGHPEPQLPQGAGPSTEGTLSSPPSALTLATPQLSLFGLSFSLKTGMAILKYWPQQGVPPPPWTQGGGHHCLGTYRGSKGSRDSLEECPLGAWPPPSLHPESLTESRGQNQTTSGHWGSPKGSQRTNASGQRWDRWEGTVISERWDPSVPSVTSPASAAPIARC